MGTSACRISSQAAGQGRAAIFSCRLFWLRRYHNHKPNPMRGIPQIAHNGFMMKKGECKPCGAKCPEKIFTLWQDKKIRYNGHMRKVFWRILFLMGLIFWPFATVHAQGTRIPPQSYGFTHYGQATPRYPGIRSPNSVYPAPRNLPLYNPYFSNQFGPLYEPYDEPCHYDEEYGIWVGPCNTSLNTPGYSITVPNRIRR